MRSSLGFTAGEPPEWDVERFLHGDEVDTALITLERNRLTFAWKCADVDADGMALRLAPSSVTLGGLLKHLAWTEELYFQHRLAGRPVMAPFDGLDLESDWEDWPWRTATDDTPTTLRALWGDAVHRSRASLSRGAVERWAGPADPRRDEPAPVAGGHDRGVRPPHRSRRPAPRGGRRLHRRRSPAGLPGAVAAVRGQVRR